MIFVLYFLSFFSGPTLISAHTHQTSEPWPRWPKLSKAKFIVSLLRCSDQAWWWHRVTIHWAPQIPGHGPRWWGEHFSSSHYNHLIWSILSIIDSTYRAKCLFIFITRKQREFRWNIILFLAGHKYILQVWQWITIFPMLRRTLVPVKASFVKRECL